MVVSRVDLDELRRQIDVIDEELVALLNQRARIVVQIGRLKTGSGAPVYAPDREKAI
ncbi:MAG: chorismate mutase, partial [Phycisphaerae bacterium]